MADSICGHPVNDHGAVAAKLLCERRCFVCQHQVRTSAQCRAHTQRRARGWFRHRHIGKWLFINKYTARRTAQTRQQRCTTVIRAIPRAAFTSCRPPFHMRSINTDRRLPIVSMLCNKLQQDSSVLFVIVFSVLLCYTPFRPCRFPQHTHPFLFLMFTAIMLFPIVCHAFLCSLVVFPTSFRHFHRRS